MKRLMYSFIVFLSIVLSATFALAKDYKVVKGDTLSHIASKNAVSIKSICEVNKAIKDPNRIYIGQVIVIPEKSAQVDQYWNWVYPNGNPFGSKRDFAKAIDMFSVPEDVKTAWKEAVKNGKGEEIQMKKGDTFDQMFFGKYVLKNNVRASWKKVERISALRYKAESSGYIYYLYRPGCYNWSWNRVKIEPKEPPPILLIPPTPVVPVEPKKEVKEDKPVESCFMCDIHHKTYLFAGQYWDIEEGRGSQRYWGFDTSIFFGKKGKVMFGPSFQYAGWDGWIKQDAGDTEYEGSKHLIGGAAFYRTDSTETLVKVRMGEKSNDLTANNGRYQAKESADLLAFEGYHQWWENQKTGWFLFHEFGAKVEIASNEKKRSTWDGMALPSSVDPALNQDEYSIRYRTHIYTGEWLTTFAEGTLAQRGFDDKKSGEIFVGAKSMGFEAGGAIQKIENENLLGAIKISLDIGDFIGSLIGKTSVSDSGSTEEDAVKKN